MPAPGGKDFLQAYNCQAVVDSAHHVILAVRATKVRATKVRAIYQQLSPAEVHGQLGRTVEQLREPFPQVAELLPDAAPDILAFTAFPVPHWQKLWSNNPQERLNREIRRRRACSRKGTWWASSPTGRRRDGWWARCWPSSMTNGPKVSATSPSPPPPAPNVPESAARSTSKGMTSFYTYLYVAVAPWIGQAAGWTRGGASFTCG